MYTHFLPQKAVYDEGLSGPYLSTKRIFVYPNPNLGENLSANINLPNKKIN